MLEAGSVTVAVRADLSALERGMTAALRETTAFDQRAQQAFRGTERAMQQLNAIASQTETVMMRINRTTGVANDSSYARRAEDIAAYAAELDRLRAKFSPVFAASKQYEAELDELNRAHKLGAITAYEHGAALAALNARYQAAAVGANAYSSSAGLARMQTANLGYQIQDISMMVLTGQSPFLLLAQQLPQITMYGGRLNGVLSALKGTVAGLFSPLGLVTTGFVLAGSAAVSYFTGANDEADVAAEKLKEQEDLIQRVADRWGDAVPALRDYADEVKRTIDLADLDEATRVAIDKQFEGTAEAFEEVRTAIGGIMNALADSTEATLGIGEVQAAFGDLDKATRDLITAQKEGKASSQDFERVSKILAGVLEHDIVASSEVAIAAVDAYRKALLEAAGASAQFAAERELLNSRDGTPLSDFGGGRGSDPRDIEKDSYWRGRYFPDPEEPARKPRAARKSASEREAERAKLSYEEMVRGAQQFIAAQQLEADVLRMTEAAANALRYEQELLNQAANDNIKLTPEMAAELSNLATGMAAAEAETNRLREAMDFAKDVTRGFFDDFRSGLEQGKSLWESFGDAALNVLNKIVDKLLNEVIDAIFQVNSAGKKGGGGGGLLDMIFGGLGSLFGGSASVDPWAGLRLADGGAFAGGNVIPFARGGSFTNSIVDRPTLFPFASGVGLMGEAGPEAIMPLRRGPDGRLGVSAANQNGGSISVPITINIDATGADTAGWARVERQLADLKRSLPQTVVATIQDAKKRRVI